MQSFQVARSGPVSSGGEVLPVFQGVKIVDKDYLEKKVSTWIGKVKWTLW